MFSIYGAPLEDGSISSFQNVDFYYPKMDNVLNVCHNYDLRPFISIKVAGTGIQPFNHADVRP